MKMSGEVVRKEAFCSTSALWDGILVSLVLLATSGAAVSAENSGNSGTVGRTARRILNLSVLRPAWVSDAGRSLNPGMTAPLRRAKATGGSGTGPSVDVPARLRPRSPFMPPPWDPGRQPSWVSPGRP